MNLEQMIYYLNEDLQREYQHWHFYTNSAFRITGLFREEYHEFLKEKAAEESLHIEQWTRLIIGRGGTPIAKPKEFRDDLTKAQDILAEALRMEKEVVSHFVERMDQAIELQKNGGDDKIHGRYVEIFLEDQILDSQGDADHLTEILKNFND